ncbi:S1C family serine protease [Haloglomus litoreum]|uniref:S1C family serine protease n=1 Tax=Haloglomus litoreum TaxID=3034026 RepID=UPI003B21F882
MLGAAGTTAALAGCASGFVGSTADQPEDPAEGPADGDGSTNPDPTATRENRYTEAYRATTPSVAVVRAYGPDGRAGQGSGFVYDGHVVTNQHVVEGADTFEVGFARQDWREGSVVGADVYSDLAVIEVGSLPDYARPLSFVEREAPVGTEVLAVGAPFGLGQSASAGIVSGVDRSLPAANNFVIPDAVQTDAAANPGNSGGPLVDLDANVVGVVNSGGGDNIAFAVSAALSTRVVPALVETGEYTHSFMGVGLRGVTPLLAEANDLPAVSGAYVASVREDAPSEGVLQGSTGSTTVNGVEVPTGGDVVVGLDETPIEALNDLSIYLALETSPGDEIAVRLIRDGSRRTVSLTLGERPDP